MSLVATASGQDIPSSCPGVPAALYPYELADGWAAVKVADGLSAPRDLVIDTGGRLLIVEARSGISIYTVDSKGYITESRMLMEFASLKLGIYFSLDGLTLYASTDTSVYGWPHDPETRDISGDPVTLVARMRTTGHLTRTLIIPPRAPDLLVVSHGSDGNFDYPSVDPVTGTAIVKVFDISEAPEGGFNYAADGWNAGYGLRNEVALAFDGNNIGDPFVRTIDGNATDIYNDNPAEELNYLGDVTKPNNDCYGYPTCFTVWNPEGITDTVFQTGAQFVLTPNDTFNDASCIGTSVPPRLSFMAHTAPVGSKFDAVYENLLISLPGSWDRDTPAGYRLVAAPFTKGEGGYESVAAANSATRYIDVFYPPDEGTCSGTTCARPVGLVSDAAGRLYMTSDASGSHSCSEVLRGYAVKHADPKKFADQHIMLQEISNTYWTLFEFRSSVTQSSC